MSGKFPGNVQEISANKSGKFTGNVREGPSQRFQTAIEMEKGKERRMAIHNLKLTVPLRAQTAAKEIEQTEASGKCPGNVLDFSWIFPGNVLEMFRKFPGHFPDFSRKFPGNVPESSRKVSRTYKKKKQTENTGKKSFVKELGTLGSGTSWGNCD